MLYRILSTHDVGLCPAFLPAVGVGWPVSSETRREREAGQTDLFQSYDPQIYKYSDNMTRRVAEWLTGLALIAPFAAVVVGALLLARPRSRSPRASVSTAGERGQ